MGRYIGTEAFLLYAYGTGTIADGTQMTLINQAINNAEAAIDSYTRRNFVGTPGTSSYSRFDEWRVREGGAFYVHADLHTLIGVQLGNSQNIPLGSVWLEPRNVGPPYRIVRLRSTYVWQWNTDQDALIWGTWGYSTAAPADIVQATLRAAKYFYDLRDQSGFTEVTGFDQAGEQPVPSGLPSDVRYVLSPYRSRTGGAV